MNTLLKLALGLVFAFLFVACNGSGQEPTATLPPSPPSPTEVATATLPPSPPTPTEIAKEEKVLTILYWQAPSLPGPYLADGYKDRDAGAVTLEPLANYDPDGELTPRLAAEIPTLENGGVAQDKASITWKLRAGLKWSDGAS